MTKNVKIILGVIAGIVGIFVGYLTITSVISNISNNRQQEQVNLKVEDNSNNKKNANKKSGQSSGSSKQNASSSNSDKKSDKSNTESDVSLIKTPVNSDYHYDANASRKDPDIAPVQSDDYYKDKVAEMSNSVANDNAATDDVKAKFTAYWGEIVSAIKQYKDVQNQYGEAASPEAANLLNDIYGKYLGTGNTTKAILDAYSHLDMNIDNGTLRMSAPTNNVSRFSMILVGNDNQQYMYVTGNYNVNDNTLRNVSATYLKDGAVARDKVNLSEQSVQTAQTPN